MKCIPGTNQILIYQDNLEYKISKKEIDLNSLFNNKNFLTGCSWVNHDNKLYVSGGELDGKPTNSFYSFDYKEDKFIRLTNMKINRTKHSSIIHENFLYVIGGKNCNQCEKYDLRTQLFVDLAPLIAEERINPILYVHKRTNYLYCFFGLDDKGKFVGYVERLKIDVPKSKWQVVTFKNESNADIFRIGCGVVDKEDKIILVGGIGQDGPKKSIINFDFTNWSFSEMENNCEEDNCIFNDTRLIYLSDNSYGNFNRDMEFVKFKFDD